MQEHLCAVLRAVGSLGRIQARKVCVWDVTTWRCTFLLLRSADNSLACVTISDFFPRDHSLSSSSLCTLRAYGVFAFCHWYMLRVESDIGPETGPMAFPQCGTSSSGHTCSTLSFLVPNLVEIKGHMVLIPLLLPTS